MAAAGADYVKEDSCCGSQQHDVAMRQYAEMRDALNASGRPIYFSLCGWNTWYAERGASLGNSWRIALDGTNWASLSGCVNKNARLGRYARPGAWNDPDLLQGTGVGSNDKPTNPHGCFAAPEVPQLVSIVIVQPQERQFSLLETPQADLHGHLEGGLGLLPPPLSLAVPLSGSNRSELSPMKLDTDRTHSPSVLSLRGVTPVGGGNRRFELRDDNSFLHDNVD